jgi:UDP-N-acetylmuramoylalanine--D-glutamate ligase
MKPKATVFEFTSYEFEPEEKRISFNYKQEFKGREPIFYTESIVLPEIPDVKDVPPELLKKLLESLHLVLGVSYYKFYCATKLKISYALTKKEADFWNLVYKNGLGEFFYRNKLDPKIAPKFPFSKSAKEISYPLPNKVFKFLVAVSGGKDSVVSAELLKEQGIEMDAIFTETGSQSSTVKKPDFLDNLVKEMGVNFIRVQRYLDKQVFEKHDYDGHIPISAVYAFLGILYAVLYKYSHFVVANEFSSNFGNIKYKGQIINHQWSKSLEFENAFQEYVRNYMTPDVYYFSLLRSFYEIRIAKLFTNYKKYFPYFSSCNRNFKIAGNPNLGRGLWCGECPKCAFTFLLLSAFLDKQELIGIFGKNLLDQANLLPLFKDILGFGKLKPFDCVGTFDESRAALHLAREKFGDSLVVKELLPKIKNPEKLVKEIFKTQESNAPDFLKFCGLDSAAILGYGKEGQVSEKYLKSKFHDLKVGILDQKTDKDYLKKQDEFDILVKTPGIPKDKVKIEYTTATNIFFSKIKARGNKIIGVTGSKGKSTTTSLIYSILKEAGLNVSISGNIGTPMLSALLEKADKSRIFIVELSSAQLDDIKFSPDIAVATNLFPEHMDYHKTELNYYQAKKNITKFQQAGNVFVYNSKNKKIGAWTKEIKSTAIPFADKIPLKDSEIPLLGEHNRDNIKAAIAVAKLFDVSDEVIANAIKSFKALPHRLEFVGEFSGIKFYDDAISTTPESTIMAIESLKCVDTIFLGGQDRGYSFSQLAKAIKKYKIKNVVLFPDSGKKIFKSRKGLNILETSSMQEAVEFAFKNTAKGKICLLSCASPSYSLWKNFEEKGDLFQIEVKNLAGKK